LAFALGCAAPLPSVDAGRDAGPEAGADTGTDAGVALRAVATGPRYAVVGEEVVLEGSASTGAVSYEWAFGDGHGWESPRNDPDARVRYAAPGRYRAVLTVRDEMGRRRTASWLVTVTHPIVHAPRQSGTIAIDAERGELAVVSPDSNELVVFRLGDGVPTFVRRHATAAHPRTVTPWRGGFAVVCVDAAVVQRFGEGAEPLDTVALPPASRPFGAVALGETLLVALQAIGELARIASRDGTLEVRREPAIEDARGVALLPDTRVAVTRWRSPDAQGELAVIADDGAREVWTLAYDPQPASDTETGGVPTYLESVLVSPTGRLAVVPALQAAIGEGSVRSGRALTFQTMVRASLRYLDPLTGREDFERRKLFDNRGHASTGAFTSRGDYLYLAMPGARTVERLDALTGAPAGTVLDVGFAPSGLAISPDDRFLFVDAYLSRELVVYDISSPGALPTLAARLPLVVDEPLSPELLLGKRLFHDAADPRLSRDSYVACAHCHLDGVGDRRVWDFTDRGEGLRNTTDLIGRAGEAHGPLHWSANFDEVHDFEHDLRAAFGGRGLMRDEDYALASMPLGAPKAGRSAELDALAAYVRSLASFWPSPHRAADGSLTAEATRGRAVFLAAGCPSCHAGPALTDSALVAGLPVLHDVGTLRDTSGARLGIPLTGLDTPTLHGLWQSAPYLHDGSAPTLRDVLVARNPDDRHGRTSELSPDDVDALIAYLLSLDGRSD
jgi:cytochrome c peroxidase